MDSHGAELRDMMAARVSLLEAMEAGFEQRHAVIDLIADAGNRPQAEASLVKELGIDAVQAGAILDARLTRWTAAERRALQTELRELRDRLAADPGTS